LWNRPLTYKEILSRMNCTLSGNETGLVAYFNFNQGIAAGNNTTISTVPDISPSGNTATLTGFILTGPNSNFVLAANSVSVNCQTALPTGVEEKSFTGSFIFPNPGNGRLNIQNLNKGHIVRIYDMLGSIISISESAGESHSLDLIEQPNGVYLIEVRSGSSVQVLKYVKE
jgi:hypothetical protein